VLGVATSSALEKSHKFRRRLRLGENPIGWRLSYGNQQSEKLGSFGGAADCMTLTDLKGSISQAIKVVRVAPLVGAP